MVIKLRGTRILTREIDVQWIGFVGKIYTRKHGQITFEVVGDVWCFRVKFSLRPTRGVWKTAKDCLQN
jgi:hypothetical protein